MNKLSFIVVLIVCFPFAIKVFANKFGLGEEKPAST